MQHSVSDSDETVAHSSLHVSISAIESNVRQTCGDLVQECVVVGSLRPCIALIVEAKPSVEKCRVEEPVLNLRAPHVPEPTHSHVPLFLTDHQQRE